MRGVCTPLHAPFKCHCDPPLAGKQSHTSFEQDFEILGYSLLGLGMTIIKGI
jgi:hypothetical protein